MTKIAVVIPVRNAEKTLERSVRSVFEQSLLKRSQEHELHVILVYNNCTDNSEVVGHALALESACDHQYNIQSFLGVHEIKMPEDQRGIVPALNTGLFEARRLGVDLIARQDADDLWHPTKLEIQLLTLERHPEVDILGTQARLVLPGTYQPVRDTNNPMLDHLIRSSLLNGHNPIAHPSVIFKTRVMTVAGVYDNLFPMAEDLWLWMKASRAGLKLANTSEVLVDYTSTHNPNYTPLSPQLAAHTLKQIHNTFPVNHHQQT